MAGSIALSLTQRYDKTTHIPLDGGKAYFYAAGTTTPQNAYQDIGLTIPWPNPITLDSGGNVPQLFFADGYIKFRLANADGVTQIDADFVLVLGPTSGGGAAPSVDATTILATGDLKVKYGTGSLAGFVRANGRSIGSTSSSASERANPDCQTLFEFLWNADPNLVVSTGRGGSSNADWVANKNIALPDLRGRALFGLDDMGNSAAGRLTAAGGFGSPTTLGAAGGSQTVTIAQSALPNVAVGITGNVSTTTTDTHVPNAPTGVVPAAFASGTGGSVYYINGGVTPTVGPLAASGTIASGSTASLNGNISQTALATAPPLLLSTYYIKL